MNFNAVYNKYITNYINEKKSDKKSPDEDKGDEKKSDKKSDKKSHNEDNSYDVLDTKKIDLITGEVELSVVDTKEKYRIHVKYLDDSKFSGYVQYDNEEDVMRTYEGINTVGELLNYINIHAEKSSSIFPALNLLKKEIIAIKRDMTEDDIAELALEFPI